MRLRWLLIALVTMSLSPSIAAACKRGWDCISLSGSALVVELSSATLTRTLRLEAPRDFTDFGAIDLDPHTRDLPPGEYTMHITSGSLTATTTTFVPHRCGLRYVPPKPVAPSKRPYLLGGLAIVGLLVALRLRKRAGTDEAHVPDCLP